MKQPKATAATATKMVSQWWRRQLWRQQQGNNLLQCPINRCPPLLVLPAEWRYCHSMKVSWCSRLEQQTMKRGWASPLPRHKNWADLFVPVCAGLCRFVLFCATVPFFAGWQIPRPLFKKSWTKWGQLVSKPPFPPEKNCLWFLPCSTTPPDCVGGSWLSGGGSNEIHVAWTLWLVVMSQPGLCPINSSMQACISGKGKWVSLHLWHTQGSSDY